MARKGRFSELIRWEKADSEHTNVVSSPRGVQWYHFLSENVTGSVQKCDTFSGAVQSETKRLNGKKKRRDAVRCKIKENKIPQKIK